VALTSAVFTAKFGPMSAAELQREDRLKERLDLQEERLEQRQDRRD